MPFPPEEMLHFFDESQIDFSIAFVLVSLLENH